VDTKIVRERCPPPPTLPRALNETSSRQRADHVDSPLRNPEKSHRNLSNAGKIRNETHKTGERKLWEKERLGIFLHRLVKYQEHGAESMPAP